MDLLRAKRISIALLCGLVLAILIQWFLDGERSGLLRRGDFPAFYAAGKIILDGRGRELYRPELQQEIENAAWPSLKGKHFAFAYPPAVAALMAPLALLPPELAKLSFSFLSLLALWSAVYLFPKARPKVADPAGDFRSPDERFFRFISLLFFAPVLSGLLGGQNVTYSMLIVAAAAHHLDSSARHANTRVGLWLGLWWFKPQYGFYALCFLLASGRRRAAAVNVAVLFVWIAVSCLVSGPSAFAEWFTAAHTFSELDIRVNGHQMVSLTAAVLRIGALIGVELAQMKLIVSAVSVAAFMLILYFVSTRLRTATFSQRSAAERAAFFAVAPALLFFAPHVLYYDLGISQLGVSRSFSLKRKLEWFLAGLFYVLTFFVVLNKHLFLISPLIALLPVSFVLLWFCFAAVLSSHFSFEGELEKRGV